MNKYSGKHLLAVVAMAGLMITLGHTSVFAQAAPLGDDISTSATIKQRILNGGFFQLIDAATAPCSGQCGVANWQTTECICPEGYAPAEFGRTLVSVGSGEQGSTCGATLYTCVWQPQ